MDDVLVRTAPLALHTRETMPRFYTADVNEEAKFKLRRAAATGRPLGGAAWLKALENTTGRVLSEPKRGRPSRLV